MACPSQQLCSFSGVERNAGLVWLEATPRPGLASATSVKIQDIVTHTLPSGARRHGLLAMGCFQLRSCFPVHVVACAATFPNSAPRAKLEDPLLLATNLPSLTSIGDCILELLGSRGRKSIFADEAEQSVASVAARCGMRGLSFDAYNGVGTSFSSFMYPSSATSERLAAVCLHQSLFLLLDDLCFDMDPAELDPEAYGIDRGIDRTAPARVQEYLRDLNLLFRTQDLPRHPTPIERAVCVAGAELRRLSTPEWFDRFADAVEDYVGACIALQADLSADGVRSSVRNLDTFSDVRCRNSGAQHIALLMEVASNLILPETVRTHSSIQSLIALYGEITSFVNDIFSYHKDVVLEGSQFNLISVLMDTQGLSFHPAVPRAIDLVKSKIRQFAEIESGLPIWYPESVNWAARRYVLVLKELIAGYYLWHSSSNRYRSTDSPFPELRILTRNL